MLTRKLLGFMVIGGCFALTQMALALYLPALPLLTHFFATNLKAVTLSLSFGTAGYAIGQLLWGSLSDHLGRKPIYAIALLLFITASTLIYFTHPLWLFYLDMALVGFSVSTFTSVGNAFMVDLLGVERAKVGVSYIGIVMSTATVLNPLIGAFLITHFGWKSIFIFLLSYALLMLIGLVLFVDETHQPHLQPKRKLKAVYFELLTHGEYLRYILTLGLSFGAFFTLLASAPYIFQNLYHVSISNYGWLFLLSSLTYLIGSIWVKWRVERWTSMQLTQLGCGIMLIGAFSLLLTNLWPAHNLFSIIIPVAILFLGFGITVPATKGGAMSIFKHHKGTAASLMKFTQISMTTLITVFAALCHAASNLFTLSMFFLSIAALSIIIHYSLPVPIGSET